jgi:hypothetical protein
MRTTQMRLLGLIGSLATVSMVGFENIGSPVGPSLATVDAGGRKARACRPHDAIGA